MSTTAILVSAQAEPCRQPSVQNSNQLLSTLYSHLLLCPSVEGYLIYLLIVQVIHKTVLLPGEARKPRDPSCFSPAAAGSSDPD